jgi:hypothetical protein
MQNRIHVCPRAHLVLEHLLMDAVVAVRVGIVVGGSQIVASLIATKERVCVCEYACECECASVRASASVRVSRALVVEGDIAYVAGMLNRAPYWR